jgi:hypothetical protein
MFWEEATGDISLASAVGYRSGKFGCRRASRHWCNDQWNSSVVLGRIVSTPLTPLWFRGQASDVCRLVKGVPDGSTDSPPGTAHLADGSSRMPKSVSSIDKSPLSVWPPFVIQPHSAKKGDRCGWRRKGVGLHRRRAGSSGSVVNPRLLDAGHSVVITPSRRTTRRVNRR